jgi:hypothetical protein
MYILSNPGRFESMIILLIHRQQNQTTMIKTPDNPHCARVKSKTMHNNMQRSLDVIIGATAEGCAYLFRDDYVHEQMPFQPLLPKCHPHAVVKCCHNVLCRGVVSQGLPYLALAEHTTFCVNMQLVASRALC